MSEVSTDIVVRVADGDDLADVVSVGHRTWPPTYEPIAGPEYVAMGLAKWWTSEAVAASIRTGRTLVAVDGDAVVGCATVGPAGTADDALALWKLYVLPGRHGLGIGSRLLEAVVERAARAGHTRIVLSHVVGNDDAAAFYRARGFHETHRESGGSGLPDSVWMERVVAQPDAAETPGPTGADAPTHERDSRRGESS